jgi:hypothetical protein
MKKQNLTKTKLAIIGLFLWLSSCTLAPSNQKEACPAWCPTDETPKPPDFDEKGCPMC